MTRALTTLPGDIPDLLCVGAPILLAGSAGFIVSRDERPEAQRWGEWVAAPSSLWSDMEGTFAAEERRSVRSDEVVLDLAQPLGRVIAAWWMKRRIDAPGTPLTARRKAIAWDLVHAAEHGYEGTAADIEELAFHVLLLAGRAPTA